ncbi:MAG: hypothetical protein AAB909_03100 [Patescibacteria group bacterium]
MQKLLQALKSKKILGIFILISLACLIYIITVSQKSTPGNLQPTTIYPADGTKPLLMFPSTAVSFYFAAPITLDMFKVKIDPQIEHKIRLSPDGLTIHISPNAKWPTEIPHTVYLLDPSGNQITKTTVTFLDPFKHPELLDEHPPGGI